MRDETFNREMLADDVNIHTTRPCEMANFYPDAHRSLRTSAQRISRDPHFAMAGSVSNVPSSTITGAAGCSISLRLRRNSWIPQGDDHDDDCLVFEATGGSDDAAKTRSRASIAKPQDKQSTFGHKPRGRTRIFLPSIRSRN